MVEKLNMAKQLLKYSRKYVKLTGIPKYIIISLNTGPSSLIGQKSWTLFNLLGHKAKWFKY